MLAPNQIRIACLQGCSLNNQILKWNRYAFGREIWSIDVNKENKLRAFENREKTRTF